MLSSTMSVDEMTEPSSCCEMPNDCTAFDAGATLTAISGELPFKGPMVSFVEPGEEQRDRGG